MLKDVSVKNKGKKMEFKDKLILVRAKLNLSQEMLAKHLNVSYVTVNRWENQQSKPTKKALVTFSEFCKHNGIEF